MIRRNSQRRYKNHRRLTSALLALTLTVSLLAADLVWAENAEEAEHAGSTEETAYAAGMKDAEALSVDEVSASLQSDGTELSLTEDAQGEDFPDAAQETAGISVDTDPNGDGSERDVSEEGYDVELFFDPDVPGMLEEDGLFLPGEDTDIDESTGEDEGTGPDDAIVPEEIIPQMENFANMNEAPLEEMEVESTDHAASLIYGSSIPANVYSMSITQSGASVRVTAQITNRNYTFNGLYVDGTLVTSTGAYSVDETINMNRYSVGYHSVFLRILWGNGNVSLVGQTYVATNLTATPTYNGVFDVNSTSFTYYPYDMLLHNQSHNLYMEWSADGGRTWTRSGYMRANMIKLYIQQAYTMSGLRPNTTYLTRIRYGVNVVYATGNGGDGKSHLFLGPALNTTTIKTGAAAKPKVKSVTAKALNVKYRKVRWPGQYTVVGGMVFYHRSWTERFYTCKVRVTVKLKKKPGTKGVWITVYDHNGISYKKWVKGNKKTYKVTIKPVYNYFKKRPKGHYKFTVNVCSGQDPNWGGYSPTYTKKKKLS